MDEKLDINGVATVLAMALFGFLKDNEGIVVHYEDKAYVVYHQDDEIKVNRDDEMLEADHLQMLWLHDPDDPDDEIPEDAPTLPKRMLN